MSYEIKFRELVDYIQELEARQWLTISAATLATIYLAKTLREKWQLPPGPTGVPLLGYLPFLGSKPYLTLIKLSETYGPVFSISFGRQSAIVLNDWPSIKEAFSKDEFLGRPSLLGPITAPSILDVSGPIWRDQRRFALHQLRDLGFGKSAMEAKIAEEIAFFLRELDLARLSKSKDNLVDVHELLTPSVSNNICILMFGKRFDYDDPIRKKMDEALSTVPRFIRTTGLLFMFPWAARVFMEFELFGFGDLKNSFKAIRGYVDEQAKEHLATLDENNPRDYIDAFLIEQKTRKLREDIGSFTFSMLCENTRGFFGAGSETVRTTMDWAMLLMADNLEIQSRVQKEIDDVIGRDRSPQWADRVHMPFTHATLMEVQRWASVVPLNLPRLALSDGTINGITIKKGTVISANFWAVHHDPKLWDKPMDFHVQHFYDESTNSVIKREYLIPFSYGKRNCVGESLAQVELWLYFASILQAYVVNPPEGVAIKFDATMGLTLRPIQKPVLEFEPRL